MVYSKAIGRADAVTYNHQDVSPRQRWAHDAGSQLIPVCPEHQPESRVRWSRCARKTIKDMAACTVDTAIMIWKITTTTTKSNLGSPARPERSKNKFNGDPRWPRCRLLTLGTRLKRRLWGGHLQTWWPPSPCWRRRCVSGPLCGE